MSKLGNSLRMLFMLKTGRLIKGKEIAEMLEVTTKEVRRYKIVLDEFFDIESVPGPNGGYRLRDTYFPFKEVLTSEEVNILKNAINSLNDISLESNLALKKAINKINYSILNNESNEANEAMIPYSKVKSLDKVHEKMIDDIYESILGNYEIYISYKDNNGNITRRRVQPYQYLRYKGEKYLVGNCLKRNNIRFFKLTRINDYAVTGKVFKKTININKLLDEYRHNSMGIFGGKEYNLVLQINPPMANTISERIWVDNQQIEKLENGSIIFKAIMKGGPEIISWILSMGECVKIIGPVNLKEEISEKLINMMENI